MTRKLLYLIPMIMTFLNSGCVKETYDMHKLSKQAHISPALVISGINGNILLSDIVKSGDTVVFDQNKFVRVVFKKDSVINLKMSDFYDLDNMVSFFQSYTIGDLSLSPFQGTIGITLDQISQRFAAALRNQFVLLNDGANHPFPSFPSTDLGERSFVAFPNFQNAVFTSGFLDIILTNNLTAPLNSINISLFNTLGHTAIGSPVIIPAVQPGQSQTVTIDLTNKTLTNSIIAAIVLSGSPGNATPVQINLANSNIQVTLQGRNLKVKSGRVILPAQLITSLDNKDTVTFNPGNGIELDKLKVTTGNITYNIQSTGSLSATLNISMPTTLRNGIPVAEVINVSPMTQFNGTISFNNTDVNLGTDAAQAYNRLPLVYGLNVSSGNAMVTFNRDDKIQLNMKLLNPVFDYVKGYFGQQSNTIDPDSIDLGIKDVLNKMTGSILVSSPSIKLNYWNSFAIPIEISLQGTGRRGSSTVNLGLAPFTIIYPAAPAIRDITGSLTIDKNNSSLPQLISMPPEEIKFSGNAKMNPAGDNSHLRNNYVFGNSRFLGSLEVEVPMEFRINNLQFSDTADNFLQSKSDGGGDQSFKPGDFEYLRVVMAAKNGFPFGVSLKMSLYNPQTKSILSTIDATDLLKPAPVDGNGKVSGVTETSTTLEFTKAFFSSIDKADKIIFYFTLNTTGNGTADIKLYSDYRIEFKASMAVKPDINFK